MDSDILEDVKKCISNALPETKPQKTHKEKKADVNDFVLDLDEDKCKKADVISGDLEVEVSPIKPVASDNHELVANVVEGRVKRAYKRKKASDVDQAVVLDARVKTRSQKAAMVVCKNHGQEVKST